MDGVAAAPSARISAADPAVAASRTTDFLFIGALFTVTFTKVEWGSVGGMVLADLLTALFLGALALEMLRRRDLRVPRLARNVLLIGVALLAVYSTGFLSATQIAGGPHQVLKGLIRLGLHFTLLAGGIAYLSWRPREYLWRAVGSLCAGIAASGLYAAAQLAVHEFGRNLDAAVITPLTGAHARTLIYGLNKSPDVPRVTGLTTDPDHLAIMLIVPILLLVSLSLASERRGRGQLVIAAALMALLLVDAATFSRSGIIGLAAGAFVIAFRYRRFLWSRRVVVPLVTALLVVIAVGARNPAGSGRIVAARVRVDHTAMTHLHQYDFVPRALRTNPAFGIGLENFGLRYVALTGKRDFGPHSFYVQSLTETGLVGTAAIALFFVYVALQLRAAARAASSRRADALVVGLTAVLVGTIVANVFYLTMTFYYFYAFLILVFASTLARQQRT
jgi:hypothetical protein